MMDESSRAMKESLPIAQVDRRRLISALAGGALLAGLHAQVTQAQSATPPATQIDALTSLSQTLCGGGVFAEAQVTQLAALISQDRALSTGLEQLLQESPSTSTADSRSTEAQATALAILLFWYTGTFKGDPVANHAAIYAQVQAWQAMYTPAWTTCKLYGAWAEPPTMTPQQLENA